MFVWFCRNYNIVDGNNRAYILCHKDFEVVSDLENTKTFRPETIKIIELQDETPKSVLMTIAAGANSDWYFYNTVDWFKLAHRFSLHINENEGLNPQLMTTFQQEFIENHFCREERSDANWICKLELLQQPHDYSKDDFNNWERKGWESSEEEEIFRHICKGIGCMGERIRAPWLGIRYFELLWCLQSRWKEVLFQASSRSIWGCIGEFRMRLWKSWCKTTRNSEVILSSLLRRFTQIRKVVEVVDVKSLHSRDVMMFSWVENVLQGCCGWTWMRMNRWHSFIGWRTLLPVEKQWRLMLPTTWQKQWRTERYEVRYSWWYV